MTVTLSRDAEERIEAAAKESGVDASFILEKLVANHLPLQAQAHVPSERNLAAIKLLQQWREEDYAATEEEAKEWDAQAQEIMKNIQENRVNFPVPDVLCE